MDTVETVSQGLTFATDEETGRSYPIPSGGSDGGDVSVGEEAGTVQGAEATPPRMKVVRRDSLTPISVRFQKSSVSLFGLS